MTSNTEALAKRQILDVVGVALAGSTQPVGKLAASFVQKTGGTPDCTVWGTELRSSPPQAAFANGIFSHALGYHCQSGVWSCDLDNLYLKPVDREE